MSAKCSKAVFTKAFILELPRTFKEASNLLLKGAFLDLSLTPWNVCPISKMDNFLTRASFVFGSSSCPVSSKYRTLGFALLPGALVL